MKKHLAKIPRHRLPRSRSAPLWVRSIPPALIVLLSGLLLWRDRAALWKTADNEKVFCFWFLLTYILLTAGSVLLCFVSFRLSDRIRRRIGWGFLFLAPLGAFCAVELINATKFPALAPLRWLANYLCYAVLFALCYAVSRRVWITLLAGGFFSLSFGVVNYFTVKYRGQPVLPWDLQAIGTAVEVSTGYQFPLTRPILLSAAALLFVVLLCWRLGPEKQKDARRRFFWKDRLAALALAGVLVLLIFPADLLSAMGISVWAWNQTSSSHSTGILAGFCANVQFLMVDKPDGYSQDAVEKLGEELGALEEPAPLGDPGGQKPTIIVVMNESLTDFQSVGDLALSEDPLSFFHSLQGSENVIWGTAYTSAYGGNTCNSEYEFLTGNTTAFFPSGSKPYQQYVHKAETALPSILKTHGYSCTAIHPGNSRAWQRNTAYPYLGFDRFLAAKDFDVFRELVHGLTSDQSHYEQIVSEYRKRDPETPQFLFTVTIQNHGGYESNPVANTIGIEGWDKSFPLAEQYLSLTKISDSALQSLIRYFARQEDPVLILVFGDHWPKLETEFFSRLLGANAADPEFSDLMREYQVPFLLWANYPLEGRQVDAISLNYLSGLLLQAAGLEGTDYTRYLESLRQQLLVITAVGAIDSRGELYKAGDETPYDDLLNDYAILQYNNVFGDEEKVTQLFERQPETAPQESEKGTPGGK